MEKLILTAVDLHNWTLDVYYSEQIYSIVLNKANFTCNLFEIHMIDKIITNALNKSECKIDNLTCEVKFEEPPNSDTLVIYLDVVFHVEPLKPIVDNIKLVLHRKSLTLEDTVSFIVHNTVKYANIAIVEPGDCVVRVRVQSGCGIVISDEISGTNVDKWKENNEKKAINYNNYDLIILADLLTAISNDYRIKFIRHSIVDSQITCIYVCYSKNGVSRNKYILSSNPKFDPVKKYAILDTIRFYYPGNNHSFYDKLLIQEF